MANRETVFHSSNFYREFAVAEGQTTFVCEVDVEKRLVVEKQSQPGEGTAYEGFTVDLADVPKVSRLDREHVPMRVTNHRRSFAGRGSSEDGKLMPINYQGRVRVVALHKIFGDVIYLSPAERRAAAVKQTQTTVSA